ncbi:MAG TPA: tetratricopeptide repeat protein [Terricaulis sp.]|nr:tetratricopeptide repeat protein [Terricaulis sp.]
MRLIALAFLLFAGLATPALAQVPPSLRSAGVTEAQWSQAQALISAQARTLNQREAALRTLAIEIFEGEPSLGFETYLELIREGAARLPQALAAARALNPRGDARLEDLRARAVSAAEQGRLREALALQDEYAAALRAALERALQQPLLDLAAAHAAAGGTAYALADHLGAAARYAEAAEAAPAGTRERWQYLVWQAYALTERSRLFAESAPLQQAVALYQQALILRPRETAPADWANAQNHLGIALALQGGRGAPGALERAVVAYEAALSVMTREADPAGWAATQINLGAALWAQAERGAPGALEKAALAYEAALSVLTREDAPARWAIAQNNLGNALALQGQRGAPGALERAVAAYEAALSVRTRAADPAAWAETQMNLGSVFNIQGARGAPGALERAMAANEAALNVITREANPVGWARIQVGLGDTLSVLGERGAAGALDRAIAAYEAALIVMTREADPAGWAVTTYNLAFAYRGLGRFAEARAAAEAALSGYEQIGNAHWANEARAFIARLPPE